MTFKFPGARDSGVRALGSVLQGQGARSAASTASSEIVGGTISNETAAATRSLDRKLGNFSSRYGVDLGRTNIDKLVLDPKGAAADVLGSRRNPLKAKQTTPGGWMTLLRSRKEPLMEFDWYPQMPLDLPAEFVEEIQFTEPHASSGSSFFMNGRHYNMPDSHAAGSVSVTLYEDRLMTASQWLKKWKSLVSKEGTFFNLPADYLLPIRIYALDVKQQVVGQFCLHGCYPSSSPSRQFGGDNNRVRLQFELSCRWITYQANSNVPTQGSTVRRVAEAPQDNSVTSSLRSFVSGNLPTIRL